MTIGYHMFTMASLWYLASFVVQSVFKYVMPKIDPKGQSVLVTGCDTGFGNMAAKSLALKGFHVFACCLFPDREGGQELATIKNITVLSLDVTKPDSIRESFKTVKSSLEQSGNSLRALVNNAGIASATFWNGTQWRTSIKCTKSMSKAICA
ncbi:D-beta-hydroxybutyrate dehydrogenase, mitochondrial [Halotydeus destructor]|nr:D-beta-hydroxybutyrate dehydrogenase, mitochondrial [Halotydeus destructor]